MRRDRPTIATERPAALAASAMLSTRATLLAKHVTATRPCRLRISAAIERRTSLSEPECPSTNALVLSHTIASTPASPSASSAASSVGGPTIGLASSFQSPVCSTTPCGVRITSACASGMECATEMNWSENGASSKEPPAGTTWMRTSLRSCASPSLRRSTEAANGVAYIGQRSWRHRWATAPMWSSCAWVITSPTSLSRRSAMKLGSGIITSTSGISEPPKPMPQSTASQRPSHR